jgi:hypothetical protein
MDTSANATINDRALLERLRRCVAEDRRTTALLLVHMGEVDARGLFRDEGFSSMFEYCVRALHMSESETALRIRVARFGRVCPEAIQMLARGELHLSAVGLLASVMRPQCMDLLQEAAFKSKREVEAIIAKHFPQPDVPSAIRKLPGTKAAATERQPSLLASDTTRTASIPESAPGLVPASGTLPNLQSPTPIATEAIRRAAEVKAAPASRTASEASTGEGEVRAGNARPSDSATDGTLRAQSEISGSAAPSAAVPSRARQLPAPAPVPLSEGRYKVQFTADQRLRDKLAQAQHLLRHQVADGDLARIVERALDLLIADRRKKLFAQVARPRDRRHAGRERAARSSRPTDGANTKPMDQASQPTAMSPCFRSTAISKDSAESTQRAMPTQTTAAGASSLTGDSTPVASPQKPTPTAAPQSAGSRPAASQSLGKNSRYIPSSVRRHVVARDGERCSFVAPDGRRCHERGWLEFHHEQPRARGGPATNENIRILCRAHNMLRAERDFGRAFMVNAVTTKQRPDATPRSGPRSELPRALERIEARAAREHPERLR